MPTQKSDSETPKKNITPPPAQRAAPTTPAAARITVRQMRAARQEELKRQQNLVTAALVSGLLIIVAIFVFQNNLIHLGGSSTSTTGSSTSNSSCPSIDLTKFPPIDSSLQISTKTTNLGKCLQYVDLKVGTGQAIKSTDTITVNYTGWLTDGTKFDSSLNTGRTPFQTALSGVIPGWTQGLVGMKVGGVRRLIIPPVLAYGATGSPPTIPANATLIFDVQLISIP